MQDKVKNSEARNQNHSTSKNEPDPPVNSFCFVCFFDFQRHISDDKLRLNQISYVFINFELRVDGLKPILYFNRLLQRGLYNVLVK